MRKILISLVVILMLVGCSNKDSTTPTTEPVVETQKPIEFNGTINLNDYFTLELTGFNSFVTFSPNTTYDFISLIRDHKGLLQWTDAAKDYFGDDLGRMTPEEFVASKCMIKLINPTEKAAKFGYSNGDIIKFQWIVDEKIEKLVDVKLEYTDIEYTVSGLVEPETVDPFEDLKFEIEGKDGQGKIKLTEGKYKDHIYCDFNGMLVNGYETVCKLGLNEYDFFKAYMLKPTRTEMPVIVEGLTK